MKKFFLYSLTALVSILFFIGAFVIIITQHILNYYGQISLDQIIFHLTLPLDTINYDVIAAFCYWTMLDTHKLTLAFIGSILLLICTILLTKNNKYKRKLMYLYGIGSCLSFIVFAYSIYYFSSNFHVLETISYRFQKSNVIDTSYYENKIDDFIQINAITGQKLTKEEKPNIILIIGESLEATFMSTDIWNTNLLKNLSFYRQEGNYAEKLQEVNGCHYTLASMYGSFYGMPLLYFMGAFCGSPLRTNLFSNKCLSIFDILYKNEYSISYYQGASLNFSFKQQLFSNVPQKHLVGADEISYELYPNRQAWGLYDRDLFEIVKKELLQLSSNEPFAIALETLDTHGDNESLVDDTTGTFGDMRDFIQRQDQLIADFISWVEKQRFASNTVIVVIGDHNMETMNIGPIVMKDIPQRTIFNCIINAKNKNKISPDRQAAVFDMAPTILEALGFQWSNHHLGIGTSLFSNEPTILEQIGIDAWNTESMKWSTKYGQLISK